MNFASFLLVQTSILYHNLEFSSVEALSGSDVRFAKDIEFPFVVSIGRTDVGNGIHLCAGALISGWHVLTSAHCLESLTDKVIQVTVGSADLRKGRKFNVSKSITYDQWAKYSLLTYGKGLNDIAIVKLTEEIDDAIVRPGKLWTGKDKKLYNQTATIVGWSYSNDIEDISFILQAAPVRIISNKELSRILYILNYYKSFSIQPRILHTKSKSRVLMETGDSGGPLIIGKDTIVGINHGTYPDVPDPENYSKILLEKSQVNGHISVSAYNSFIKHCIKHF